MSSFFAATSAQYWNRLPSNWNLLKSISVDQLHNCPPFAIILLQTHFTRVSWKGGMILWIRNEKKSFDYVYGKQNYIIIALFPELETHLLYNGTPGGPNSVHMEQRDIIEQIKHPAKMMVAKVARRHQAAPRFEFSNNELQILYETHREEKKGRIPPGLKPPSRWRWLLLWLARYPVD